MKALRIPLVLTCASVVGLVVALAASGSLAAVGVALATSPLVAVIVAFRRSDRHAHAR